MAIKRIGVLFVCLGNICRSPAAEGAFRHLVEMNELEEFFDIDSCGTANYHVGELPHETTISVARSRGIVLNHRCRQFSHRDFERFEYIAVMDKSNYANVVRMTDKEDYKAKVFKFRKFDPHTPGEPDVPDPYSEPLSTFEFVQDIVERCSESLLAHILDKYKLRIPAEEEVE